MGMDRETREKMFTLFFTSKGSQGTGLGLFIANRVISQHGGEILVESTLGKGTSFHIWLPKEKPPASVIEAAI
jgi:signal transduction histidine kinase